MGELGYKIRIKRGDLEIEVQGDKQFVLDKFGELRKELFGLVNNHLSELPSLVEFLNEKNPMSHPDRVVVMAYYLRHYEGIDVFNVNDINNCYSKARITRSANLNATINKDIFKGYIMETREKRNNKKAWMITQIGENYVEKDLRSS